MHHRGSQTLGVKVVGVTQEPRSQLSSGEGEVWQGHIQRQLGTRELKQQTSDLLSKAKALTATSTVIDIFLIFFL